jgi:hypothetical protein
MCRSWRLTWALIGQYLARAHKMVSFASRVSKIADGGGLQISRLHNSPLLRNAQLCTQFRHPTRLNLLLCIVLQRRHSVSLLLRLSVMALSSLGHRSSAWPNQEYGRARQNDEVCVLARRPHLSSEVYRQLHSYLLVLYQPFCEPNQVQRGFIRDWLPLQSRKPRSKIQV